MRLSSIEIGFALCLAVLVVGPVTRELPVATAASSSYAMIGDSITWQAQDHLREAIPDAHIDGVIGRSFTQADEALAEMSAELPEEDFEKILSQPWLVAELFPGLLAKPPARVAVTGIRSRPRARVARMRIKAFILSTPSSSSR